MRKFIIILTISQLIFSCSTVNTTSKFSFNPKEKKSVSIVPEGKESIKFLFATISTDTITTKGSKVALNCQNIDSIITDNLIPVLVFVSNPSNSDFRDTNYGKGRLSGSGTIYVYLEEESEVPLGDKNRVDKVKRISNVLSVYATFKP